MTSVRGEKIHHSHPLSFLFVFTLVVLSLHFLDFPLSNKQYMKVSICSLYMYHCLLKLHLTYKHTQMNTDQHIFYSRSKRSTVQQVFLLQIYKHRIYSHMAQTETKQKNSRTMKTKEIQFMQNSSISELDKNLLYLVLWEIFLLLSYSSRQNIKKVVVLTAVKFTWEECVVEAICTYSIWCMTTFSKKLFC